MKVLWICHFSNANIRKKISLSKLRFENLLRILFNKSKMKYHDYAFWISNKIADLENCKDVELHDISPHYGMKRRTEKFVIKGINYLLFKPDDNFIFKRGFHQFMKKPKRTYGRNREMIRNAIEAIKPDIIHMYGAENPYYSISALDIDLKTYPLLVSLQTLLNDPEFKARTTMSNQNYCFRSEIERKILCRVKYLGSSVKKYREFVWNHMNSHAIFTETFLGAPVDIAPKKTNKCHDFVYFAASISKAADIAIEAFAIACQNNPQLTLNIVGNTPQPFTQKLQSRIKELGIEENVTFSGRLITHEDVLIKIQQAKYALLPLKIDFISSTICEAMFSGLPVVTTLTSGTPFLNEKRESVLISEQGDYQGMARNMLKLVDSDSFAEIIKGNAFITAREIWSNARNIAELVAAYQAILEHHKHGVSIPEMIGATNPGLCKVK